MKSLYRKFVAWLARDIIREARGEAFNNGKLIEKGAWLSGEGADDYQAGISYAQGQRQLQDAREHMMKEFKSLFPRLTTYQDEFDNPRIMINPNVGVGDPLAYFMGKDQLDKAIADGWDIALTTGTKPMEF